MIDIFFGWFRSRKTYWGYYKKGRISFTDALWCMLPSPFRPEELTYYNFNIWKLDQYRQSELEKTGKKNPVIVDAGASRGSFSILATQKFPEATIYAFEPTPYAYERLKRLTRKYPNIHCFSFALGDENKMTYIVDNGGEGGTNNLVDMTTPWANKKDKKFPVEMVRLDDILVSYDFIKIDTEGAEGIIIKGAAETIKRSKPIMAMSAYHHPEDKEELPKIISNIADYNFEIVQEDEEDLICIPQ